MVASPASIGASTRLCAVIGKPVRHSLSPAIHNAAFAELGLDLAYVAFEVEDVASALSGCLPSTAINPEVWPNARKVHA